MSPDKLLALHHFCTAWHAGQFSREYRIGCRVSKVFTPSRSEEFIAILAKPDYEQAREYYVALVKSTQGDDGSGYVDCVECGMPVVVDDMRAERSCTACDDCKGE